LIGFAGRNQPDDLTALSECDVADAPLNFGEHVEPDFTIIEAFVFHDDFSGIKKDGKNIGKIKPVLCKVACAFGFISPKFHGLKSDTCLDNCQDFISRPYKSLLNHFAAPLLAGLFFCQDKVMLFIEPPCGIKAFEGPKLSLSKAVYIAESHGFLQ
jgi:hypothetical protein